MIFKIKHIESLLFLIVLGSFLTLSATNSNAQTLYSCEPPFGGDNPFLHTINQNTGATLTTTEITLEGYNVRGCNGMAKHPQTGVCYMMLNVTPDEGGPVAPRLLATIDQNTGVATAIGGANQTFATLAFTADGTLYGITGDGGTTPETLFTININNGSTSQVTPLGNGGDGETLAYNPDNGLLYHGSGNCLPGQIFESIHPQTLQINPIPLIGDPDICEQSAMVYGLGNVFLTGTIDLEYYSISTNGVVTFIGDMDHASKGLAFDCGIVPTPRVVPTLSEWGLIVTAAILGIVGFMVIRRRRVAA